MTAWYRRDGEDLLLHVRLQPRAAQDAVMGVHGDALRIRLTAPPVAGRANAVLCDFLARRLGVPKSQVVVERGRQGRDKWVRVRAPRRPPEVLLAS